MLYCISVCAVMSPACSQAQLRLMTKNKYEGYEPFAESTSTKCVTITLNKESSFPEDSSCGYESRFQHVRTLSNTRVPSKNRSYIVEEAKNNADPLVIPLKREAKFSEPQPCPDRIDWTSLTIVYVLTLVSEASRGLLMPTLWPFFRSHGGTQNDLGAFIAAISFGRMLATVPIGLLSDHFSTTIILCLACLTQCFAHLLYACAPSLRILYLARIICGIGSTTTSLGRAHLTYAVPAHVRTQYFGYLSAIQFAGVGLTPVFGGLLAFIPSSTSPFSFAPLNGCTYPAYVLALTNLLCAFLVREYYKEPARTVSTSVENSVSQTIEASTYGSTTPTITKTFSSVTKPDFIALVICLLVNLFLKGVTSAFETVIVPFLSERYDLSIGSASSCVSILGFAGVLIYCSMRFLAHRTSDRRLVLRGLIIICVGCLALSIRPATSFMGVPIYIGCIGIAWSVGAPIAQAADLSLFSKLLVGLPVGGFIGIFSTSGALAPLVAAVFATKIWTAFGQEAVFMSLFALVSTSCLLVVLFYRRLTISPVLP